MAGCPTPSVLWRFERATSVLKTPSQQGLELLKPKRSFIWGTNLLVSYRLQRKRWSWSTNSGDGGDTITDINTRRWEMCCSRETIFSQVTHIYPISELGQNNVDYWTHLMLKTNTSYFTGSSQLNNRFFFHSCNTLRNIHSHGCIQTIFLSFWFFFQ